MSTDKSSRSSPFAPVALASLGEDVAARFSRAELATPTGIASFDRLLAGGLRRGMLVALGSEPGVGRTTLALMIAYMAARSKAAVLVSSVGLDAGEILARLGARAAHRERADVLAAYGSIANGAAMQEPSLAPALAAALETVVKKVGGELYLHRAANLESTAVLAECAARLCAEHERVVVVVDDAEGFYASADGNAAKQAAVNATLEGRVQQIAFDLKAIADRGAAVVMGLAARYVECAAPAATLIAELRQRGRGDAPQTPEALLALGARSLDLVVTKNRFGPTGRVPLRIVPGATLVDERGA